MQDYGVGVPNGVIPNLFTKFYRDHRNRSQIGGTGLGLYLSKAIVSAHGGTIWLRSKEGEEDIVAAVFEFSELPNPFDIPQNLDLVIDVNGAQVWASKLD